LILAPTREIANQTKAVLDVYGAPLGVRSAVLIGGIDMRLDTAALNTYPQVIVATPGRLCDHLDRGNIWLDYLEVVILDEADRMLDMGFSDQLNRILDDTPKSRQTMLFSATFPPAVEKLARKILHEPRRITIGRSMKPTDAVEQHFIFTEEADKVREVSRILIKETGSCFVFARSKERTTNLWRSLRAKGILDAAHLHSDLRQRDREQALADFKEGKYRILVATDVMGRGIDVAGVAHVINYDLPRDPSDYIHRIGRTGRAAATGKATSLITRGDRETVEKLEKILGRPIRPGGGGGSAGAGEARSGDGGRGGEGRRDERDGGGRGGSRGGGQQRGGRGGSGGFSRGGRSDGPRAAVVGGESRGPRPVTAVQPIRADRAFAEFSAAPGESGAESSAGPVVGVGPQQSGRVGDGGDGTQRRRRRRGGRGRRKPGTDSGPVEGGGSAGGAPQGE
jgi:ATP-dependent RNA helicase RhlE